VEQALAQQRPGRRAGIVRRQGNLDQPAECKPGIGIIDRLCRGKHRQRDGAEADQDSAAACPDGNCMANRRFEINRNDA
jgi:hypothetical protein